MLRRVPPDFLRRRASPPSSGRRPTEIVRLLQGRARERAERNLVETQRVRQRLVVANADVREPAWSPYRTQR